MPVYIVKVPNTEPPVERLVEAPNQASARSHVARSLFAVQVAKGADLFRLAKAGVELEQAVAEPAEVGGLAELQELATTQTDDTRKAQGEPPADKDDQSKAGKAK